MSMKFLGLIESQLKWGFTKWSSPDIHLYILLGLHIATHYQQQFSVLLCSHMTINNSSLVMSMSNLTSININIMDMKRHILIYLFIPMLVGMERG